MKGWMVTVPAGLIALIGLIADKGEKLVQVLSLLGTLIGKLPLGVWSVLGVLALAMLVWATLIRKLQPLACGKRNGADADLVTVGFSTLVLPLLQWAQGADRATMLLSLLFGFGVGLLAPFLCRLIERCIPRKAVKPLPAPVDQ